MTTAISSYLKQYTFNPQDILNLMIPISNESISFCYYNTICKAEQKEFIDINTIKSALRYFNNESLVFQFIYGFNDPPEILSEYIETTNHVKIVPVSRYSDFSGSIPVIGTNDYGYIDTLPASKDNIAILKISKDNISDLQNICTRLLNKFLKINIILTDILEFDQNDFDNYKTNLLMLSSMFIDRFNENDFTEINIISDRLLLTSFNDCGCGINHITLSIDGSFHICPGFKNSFSGDNIGNINEGIHIANYELLSIEKAPICYKCDAFHCKRCLYLNILSTLEINIPSKQQCLVSHIERNCSRFVQQALQDRLLNIQNKHLFIPNINYLDPLDILKNQNF